jgi:hypothetical protein
MTMTTAYDRADFSRYCARATDSQLVEIIKQEEAGKRFESAALAQIEQGRRLNRPVNNCDLFGAPIRTDLFD